jgi:hypothetical protein
MTLWVAKLNLLESAACVLERNLTKVLEDDACNSCAPKYLQSKMRVAVAEEFSTFAPVVTAAGCLRTRSPTNKFLISAAAAFIGFVALQYSVPVIDYQLNADSMYIFMITKDILFDGGHLRDWFVSVHLFFYPDTLLAVPILLMQQLGISVFVGCISTYGLLLISLTAYAWRKITREPLARCLLVGSALVGTVFYGDYLLYQLVSRQAQTPDLLKALKHTYAVGHVLGPALHSGAFILAFALFFPLHSSLTNMRRSFAYTAFLLAWLSANVFLVTLSDLMFLAWGVIPLSIVVLSGTMRNSPGRSALVIVFLWAFAISGYIVSRLVLASDESTYLAAVRRPLSEALNGLVDFGRLAASMTQPSITFFFCTNVLLWCAGAYFFLRELTSPVSSVSRCLAIFAAGMSATSILAPAAAGLFTGGQIRYLIPYLVLGPSFCVFLIFLAARRLLPSGSWSACLVIGACLIFSGGSFAWATLPGPTASRLYQCLQGEGLRLGMADFWDAAPVVVASGWRVRVAPLAPGTLNLFPWLTKRQWLQQTPDVDLSNQTFLILDPDMVEKALAVYGSADLAFSCAGRRILVYKHASWVDRDAAFQYFSPQ